MKGIMEESQKILMALTTVDFKQLRNADNAIFEGDEFFFYFKWELF